MLNEGLNAAIDAVPAHKRGMATVTLNTKGVEGMVGARIWKGLSAGAYAGRAWSGEKSAGVRGQFVW